MAIAGWEPYLPTPPIQDHPSTHAMLGAAAILQVSVGDEGIAMTSTTVLAEVPGSLESFSAVVAEDAE